jgi:NarL family two-component system response regulator LiaR
MHMEPRVGHKDGAVTVVLADDDPLVRTVLRQTLQAGGLAVIGEATTGREAIELATHYRPDVLLIDLVMPEGGALEVAGAVRAASPKTAIVVLTGHPDEEAAVDVLRAGASGFLTKDLAMETLPRALRAAAAGEPAVSRKLVTTLVDRLRSMPQGEAGLRPVKSPLTPREWEVLDLLATGATMEDVATELVLSMETVRSHVKNILRKTGAHSRAEAIAKADELRRPSSARTADRRAG